MTDTLLPIPEPISKFTHQELVDIAARWARNRHGVVVKEFACLHWEIADVIAFTAGYSTLIECKASRADFLADKKKVFRSHPEMGMGNYRIYCAPKGMIKESELPDGWALLEINEGKKAKLNVDIYKFDKLKTIFWFENNK